jgi:hypothetical protein
MINIAEVFEKFDDEFNKFETVRVINVRQQTIDTYFVFEIELP